MLKDKVVVLCGAAGSLGPSVAAAFLKESARLVLVGRDRDRLMALRSQLATPDRVSVVSVDLGDEPATRASVHSIGHIDVVLHMVGGYRGGTALAEAPLEDWEFLQASLVRTTFNVVRAVAGQLKANGWGRFVAVSSPRAQAPTSKGALYAAAKAASDALVLALADDFRGKGATANLLLVESIGKGTPPDQIAAAMVFLCSDEASSINGVRIPLTGRGLP
jgi:NADP-dependent 3-hydroxy acid dehydrogenase YdfG